MWCSRLIVRKTRKTRTIKFLAAATNTSKAWLAGADQRSEKGGRQHRSVCADSPEAPFLADLAMDFASILSKEYADAMMKAGTTGKLTSTQSAPVVPVTAVPKRLRIRYKAFDGYWGTNRRSIRWSSLLLLTLPCVMRNCRRMNAR
ncbi:dipeptide ABC transporter, substrate-binding protein [Escherichia coli]|nr:dipeptide ABC transporter, substrate-binding protein [Escherichia coli]